MNVALVSLYLPSGSKIGVGYQVHMLANALTQRGHAVTVFSQTGHSEGAQYETVVVPSGARLRTFGFAWNLRGVDFSKFDVLNAHGDDWFLWGKKRPRHIHTYHGSCLAEMQHARTLPGKARMGLLALCETAAGKLADDTTTVSSNTRRWIPFVKRVIPCGVDLTQFTPGDLSEKSENPTLLFVGTLGGRKRGQFLLDLWTREIHPKLPNAELWAVCEEKIDAPGVRWFGRVPHETLTELFRRAWAFCLPSTYEGFGVPYIEAMASGTPVVAAPNAGAVEVTQNGEFGLLASDDTLSETISSVLTDEKLRNRLRAAGLRRAQDFGWDTVCAAYEDVYQ